MSSGDKQVVMICATIIPIAVVGAIFVNYILFGAMIGPALGLLLGILTKNKGYTLANKKILITLACIAVFAITSSLLLYLHLYEHSLWWVIATNLICFSVAAYLLVKSIRQSKED